MITMGIGFGAGVFYWLADYKLAFWILVYAIIYGALGALRDYNQTQPVYRQGSGLTIAILIPVAGISANLPAISGDPSPQQSEIRM
jgi:hypothetical protein